MIPQTFYTEIETPLCAMRLTSDGENLTGLFMLPSHAHAPEIIEKWEREDSLSLFIEAKAQINAYFCGELKEFSLPIKAEGTPFQKSVWDALLQIPYGETISYGEIAKQIGNLAASRAVGMANGKNPISIIVPCHRVIGANGKLVGYGGGMPRKIALLELEASHSLPVRRIIGEAARRAFIPPVSGTLKDIPPSPNLSLPNLF